MQGQFKAKNNQGSAGYQGFKARTASTPDTAVAASAPAGGDRPAKKVTGKVLFRVKQKDESGKWNTLGSLFENTDTATGDIFYSFSVMEGVNVGAGIYRTFDATIPPPAKK